MSYSCRVDENTTVYYDGKGVSIVHEDNYWGRTESSSVPISNISLLIKALQDIQKQQSYDRW
jgi:hypothetical protein